MIYVLVPEASVRLIMQDKGWDEEQPAECPAWQVAWKEAFNIRHASSQFGRYRYPESAEV